MRDSYELKRWIYSNYPPTTKKVRKGKPLKTFECAVVLTIGSAVLAAFIWYMTTIPW